MCNHLRFLTALNFVFFFFFLIKYTSTSWYLYACIHCKLYDQCNSQFNIIFKSIIFIIFSSFGTCLIKISSRIRWFLDLSVHFFYMHVHVNLTFSPPKKTFASTPDDYQHFDPALHSQQKLTSPPAHILITLLLSNDKVLKQKKFNLTFLEVKMPLVFILGGGLNPWLQEFWTAETGALRHSNTDQHRPLPLHGHSFLNLWLWHTEGLVVMTQT